MNICYKFATKVWCLQNVISNNDILLCLHAHVYVCIYVVQKTKNKYDR